MSEDKAGTKRRTASVSSARVDRSGWLRRLGPPLSVLIGILLVAEAVFYAADSFYFTDTWPIVFFAGWGVLLIVIGSALTTTASLWRHVVEVPLSPEQLWIRLVDPLRVGDSWPAVTSTEVLERDEDGSAVRWLSRVRRGVHEGVIEVRVASKVPNSLYGYRTSSGSYAEYTLDRSQDGTRVTRVEMSRTSLLGRLLKPFVALQYSRIVEKHLRSLAGDNQREHLLDDRPPSPRERGLQDSEIEKE